MNLTLSFPKMCNLYDIGPKRSDASSSLEHLLQVMLESLPKLFGIRKTDAGAIVRTFNDSHECIPARWGFHRHFNPAVNNARVDKLDNGMWGVAWREKRRCVIPVSCFYEWTGPKGRKQTHAIEVPDQRMWMAGLWEMNNKPEIGLSFTTLTTDPNETMQAIHNRMPVLLEPQAIDEFLNAEDPRELMKPFAGELTTYRCENPLVKGAQVGPPIPIGEDPLFR